MITFTWFKPGNSLVTFLLTKTWCKPSSSPTLIFNYYNLFHDHIHTYCSLPLVLFEKAIWYYITLKGKIAINIYKNLINKYKKLDSISCSNTYAYIVSSLQSEIDIP